MRSMPVSAIDDLQKLSVFEHGGAADDRLPQNHPEDLRHLAAHVLPAVRCAAIEIGAVPCLERMGLPVVTEHHLALHDIEELHLARLQDHLVGLHTLAARTERRDHRADLTVKEPRAEHVPPLGCAVERHDRIVRLSAHVQSPVRRRLEERPDRHTEGGCDLSERVKGRSQSTGLDLRDHARRQARLLGEMALLELTLGPESLDPLSEARHVSDELSDGSPANPLNARLTNTRVIFFRYVWVRSVLSSGLDGTAARDAVASITSAVSRWPSSMCPASTASRGNDATAPSTIRACRTISPSMRRATATPRTGKSKEPRRRSLRYADRSPSAGGSVIWVSSSSGRFARYSIPSSR